MIRLAFAAAFLAAVGVAFAAQAQWPPNSNPYINPYQTPPFNYAAPTLGIQQPQMPGGFTGSTVGNTTTFYGTGSNAGRNLSCTRAGQFVNCY